MMETLWEVNIGMIQIKKEVKKLKTRFKAPTGGFLHDSYGYL